MLATLREAVAALAYSEAAAGSLAWFAAVRSRAVIAEAAAIAAEELVGEALVLAKELVGVAGGRADGQSGG